MADSSSFRVEADDFVAFQKAMRSASKDIHNQFRKELRRTLGYARDDIKEFHWSDVEDKLNSKWQSPPSPPIAKGDKNIKSSVSYRSARISATSSSNMRLLNAGMVRHPGYQAAANPTPSGQGGGWPWYTTPAPSGVKGWWDRAMADVTPFVVEQSQLTIEHYADKIARDINNG
jgi:hypothetical protein